MISNSNNNNAVELDQDIENELNKNFIVLYNERHYIVSIEDITRNGWNFIYINDILIKNDVSFDLNIISMLKNYRNYKPIFLYKYLFRWFCIKLEECFIFEEKKIKEDIEIKKIVDKWKGLVAKIFCYFSQTFIAQPYTDVYHHINLFFMNKKNYKMKKKIQTKNIPSCYYYYFKKYNDDDGNIKKNGVQYFPSIANRQINIETNVEKKTIQITQCLQFDIVEENFYEKEIKKMFGLFEKRKQIVTFDICNNKIRYATKWMMISNDQ